MAISIAIIMPLYCLISPQLAVENTPYI